MLQPARRFGVRTFLAMSVMEKTKSNGCALTVPPDDIIFGHSEIMRNLQQAVEQIAAVQLPVLIYGETGTGKEVLANYIHRHSRRENGPFVKISCAAIPASLLEAELFGYEEGAFTGAYSTKPGLVEQADTGTLLLDHIAELDVTIQAKLLQLLQDGTFTRIGGERELKIDTRIICIASRSLQEETANGRFRLDLFHRINGASFRVPELRERSEDIPVDRGLSGSAVQRNVCRGSVALVAGDVPASSAVSLAGKHQRARKRAPAICRDGQSGVNRRGHRSTLLRISSH